jgi:hypothetical protein
MIPERDYVLAKGEVRRRREEADAQRAVREARRIAREQASAGTAERCDEQPAGAMGWLRRLAGAR